MTKMFLILFLSWGLCVMPGVTTGQQIYKWVDEKGTVHFSETPTSDNLKPQGKQNSKERTLEVVTGVEKTREPSKEEVLIEYLKKRDREQDALKERKQADQDKRVKAINDQQEEMRLEMQRRRDKEADMLEKEARKTKTVYDHNGRLLWSRMTKGQQQMLRDAARLRSGLDPEGSPPPSKEEKRRRTEADDEDRMRRNKASDLSRRVVEESKKKASDDYHYKKKWDGLVNSETGRFCPKVGGGYHDPDKGFVWDRDPKIR